MSGTINEKTNRTDCINFSNFWNGENPHGKNKENWNEKKKS